MNSYEQITQKIIENLEAAKSWSSMISYRNYPVNITGRPYQGINRMLLYNTTYKSRIWATFRQIVQYGGKIRKGESSSIVAFWSRYLPPKQGEEKPKERWYLKCYRVFNTDQCDWLEENEYLPYLQGKINEEPAFAVPEEVVGDYLAREGIDLHTDKLIPCAVYKTSKDGIVVPERSMFKNNDEYYLTLYHELVHSTGHPKRLKRFEVGDSIYGSSEYSLEELVAEIGANFLASETDINADFMNSVAYIKGWIPKLKEHPKWIVSAAAKAEAAANFILKGGSDHEPD